MSFESEYMALRKKRKQEEAGKVSGNSFADNYAPLRENRLEEEEKVAPVLTSADINVQTTPVSFKEKKSNGWFQGGAFSDGYDFGDVTKTLLGTFNDVQENVFEAVGVATENIIDTGAEFAGQIGGWFGNKDFEEKMYKWANGTDLLQSEKTAKKFSNISNWTNPIGLATNLLLGNKIAESNTEEYSVLGEKSDGLVQSAANMFGAQALKAIPGVGAVISPIAMFNNAYRAEMRNAYANGATVDEAQRSAVISGGAELILENIGGMKIWSKFGLTDIAKRKIAQAVASKGWRTALSYASDVFAEGGEEVLTELFSRIGQNLTYMDDESLGEYLTSEEAFQSYLDSAIGGAVMGMAGGSPNVVNSAVTGRDMATNLTTNEEAVVKKVYEAELAEAQKKGEKVNKNKLWDDIVKQMDRGEISVDTIEEVLGGDEFTAYKNLVDEQNAHLQELAGLFEGDELKAQTENYLSDSKRGELKSQLGKNVFGKVISEKGSRLLNSYAETEARGVKFTADVNAYEGEYAKKTIQNIIDAESGNNTRLMHELADLLAKTSEDKKTVFSITDAKKLAGTSFAFKNQTTDGYVIRDDNGVVQEVVINLDSPKYLNRVVGHEVTHVLEGTEFYKTFRGVVEKYAESKGEYETELANAIRLYSDKDGYKGQAGFENIKKEVVANLAGKYIFSDTDFVKTLSVKNRNIFEKIYDEIKYFCKVATAGSKEARDLERVKKAFEDAYRAEGVKKTDAASGRQLSVSDGSNVERTIYIKDGHTESGETVSFIDLILDGKKKGETRTHKSLTRKWVGIAKDGLVYGRVRLGEPYLIGKDSPEYQYSFIEGTEYDLKDDEQKYYYPIEEIEDFRDNPKPIVSNGNYGTYQYSVPDADTLTEAGKGKDIEVVGGVAVASNVADVLKSPEYKKPKDYMVSYSVSSTPAWEKNYLEQHHSANDLKVVDAVRSFTEKMVQDDAVRGYVPMGEYRYTKMGPLRSNMEYIVSFDMDTSCPRTFQFLNFRDAIQRKAGRYLTYNESINLLELMRAYGQQIPCCYCYVENKRVLLSASYNNFFGFRNAVLNAETDAEAEKLMYGYDAKKGLPEASRKVFERWRSDLAYNPSLTDVWTATNTARNSVLNFLDAQKEAGIINEKTAVSKLNKMVTEEFGITDKGAIAEVESFVNDWSYDTLANIPHMYNIDNDIDVSSVDERALALNHEALAYSKSASSAKSVENYVPYTDQLKNISKEDRDYIMGMGGIRKHSSNDFRMDYVQDYFLFYADLAAEGWTGHTYTKSADFTRIFACTNDRINMSIAFYEDSDGELRENLDEGASWKDVKELRKAYKNVGAMAMVTSDNQLSFALNADWIDMIIPFHASGLDKAVWYDLRMWNDYTSKQSERFFNAETMRQRLVEAGVEIPKNAKSSDIKTLFDETFQIKHIYGKKGEVLKPHFFPGDTYVNGQLVPGHHNDVDTYFKLCEEYGVHPRFYGIKVSDTNGNQVDVTEHPSYLKLIKETARTDSEQETIQFNFGNYDPLLKMTPFEYAMKRLQEEAKNGGFENTKADPYGVVDEFVNEYLDKDRPLGYLTERAKETRDILLEMSKEAAKQQADIVGQETEALSLSESGATPVSHSATEISGADVRLQTTETYAPVVESAQNTTNNVQKANVVQNPLPDNLAPASEQMANQQQTENISTITDADAPGMVESSAPERTTNASTPSNPFEKRDYREVGSPKVNSFADDNPEVRLYFQEMAQAMLGDLQHSIKGEQWYNDELYYSSHGEQGIGGVKRDTTADIATLLDGLDGKYHYSYQQIEDGLNRIINGEKPNACSKRIEFALNDRLMNGYTDVYGNEIPPNQDYLNLLGQMQTKATAEQSAEAEVFTDADVPGTNDIAPPVQTAPKAKSPVAGNVAPDPVSPDTPQERGRVAQIRAADKQDKGGFWQRTKKMFNDFISLFGDKGISVENLSHKIGDTDRELQASYDYMRNRSEGIAQARIETELMPIMGKAEATGNRDLFDEYAYTLHHIDRMSLDSDEDIALRAELRKDLEGYTMQQIERMASETITRNTPQERTSLIFKAQQYVDLGGDKGKNKSVLGDVTKEEAIKRAKEIEAKHPEFKAIEDEVVAFNRGMLQDAVEAGLLTQKQANKWMKMYPHYVPVVRLGKNGNSVSVPLHANRTGVNSPFKRATGGNSDMLTLFEAMAKNVENITHAISRNEFGNELFEALEVAKMIDANELVTNKQREAINQGGLKEGQRVVAHDRDNVGTIEGFNPKTGKYSVYFKNKRGYYATVDIDAKLITPIGVWDDSAIEGNEDANPEGLLENAQEKPEDTNGTVVTPAQNGMPPQFTIFVKGKRVTFDITPEIYDSMIQNETVKKVTDNPIVEGINKVGKARRAMLTKYDPFFALVRNPIRDTIDVFTNSRHAGRTYWTGLKKTHKEFITKGKYYQEFYENGGLQISAYDRSKMSFKKDGKVARVGKAVVKPYDATADVFEQYWRLSEYIASREQGKSIKVALLDAARVTTNFGAGGDVTKAIDRAGGMFINPSVQGVMQTVRNFREAHIKGDVKASVKNYAILGAKLASLGIVPMIANLIFWDDDEDYEELSDYVKQNYHIVGKTADGKFIRIPKGRMQAVMQNAFEQMVDAAKGEDEIDFKEFGEIVANNLGVNNPLENNLFSPLKQAFGSGDAGKTWYGEDLVPTRLQDLPAEEQYDETTDEISKFIGKATKTSPYKWNYVLDQYGAGVADMVLPMLTAEAEGENFLAPIRDEFVSDPLMKNQNVSDFYTLKDELTVKANASTATEEDYLKSSYMNAINSDLAELYAEKREIQNDTYLSDADKYAKVRAKQQEIVDLARKALNSYEDVNIQGTYATVGDVQYRYYTPGEDSTAEPGWRKLSDEQIEKQNEVTSGLGISASEYWSNKEEYDYAYEKPEKYAVARAVGGYKTFRNLSSELYDIKADKDSSGKSISGSRKEKVIDYINELDLDYGEKIILFKSEYNADDTYNMEIINYLNSRRDLSYKDIETILKELGFTVDSNGNIYWD